VYSHVDTDVSEEHAAFIFRIKGRLSVFRAYKLRQDRRFCNVCPTRYAVFIPPSDAEVFELLTSLKPISVAAQSKA
jgi:hypothetical protein